MQKSELFDKDYCNACWRPILNNRPDKIAKMVKRLKEVWSNPKKRQEMSVTMKKRSEETGYMIGKNNPMKCLKTRKKVGETRSKGMTVSERKKYSVATSKAWQDGKFIGKKTTQCEWYDYVDRHGHTHKCQGTWELKYAEYLDMNEINFSSHSMRIQYLDSEGGMHHYYPDFYLMDTQEHIDVKASYWLKRQREKFDMILSQTTETIVILTEDKLRILGIDL